MYSACVWYISSLILPRIEEIAWEKHLCIASDSEIDELKLKH
jgi:hypothetical protein